VRIDGLTPLMARSLLAALPKAVPSFKGPMEEAGQGRAYPVQGPAASHPTPSVAMLVTLAAADPAIERRRKEAKQAERGIEALDRLHKELVAGTPAPERLREIAEWSQTFETADDPVLASLLSDIDLRVRVELAKHDIQA
jgi:hypothetical protein